MLKQNFVLKWCFVAAITICHLPALNAGKYVVSTIAGTAGIAGLANNTGNNAKFNFPAGITSDTSGNIYVTEAQNNTVRKITPAGVVTNYCWRFFWV